MLEMIYTKRIFYCICPCPSPVVANSKSLLTTHIHSFLHSVSFTGHLIYCRHLPLNAETQKLKKASGSQFGGLGFQSDSDGRNGMKNMPFKSKRKNWFLTVQKLRADSQRTHFEVCLSPRSHPLLPTPSPTSQRADRGQADIRSSVALWSRHYLMLHGSLVHSGTRRNGASRTFHPASHLMMYLKRLFLGCLMNDIYKVSFSSLNQKILKFLLSYAPQPVFSVYMAEILSKSLIPFLCSLFCYRNANSPG